MSAIGLRLPATKSAYKRQTPTLLRALGQSIWRALEASGQRRAARELRLLAARWQPFDPERAQLLLEASRHNANH